MKICYRYQNRANRLEEVVTKALPNFSKNIHQFDETGTADISIHLKGGLSEY